jgi:hypothetical protein
MTAPGSGTSVTRPYSPCRLPTDRTLATMPPESRNQVRLDCSTFTDQIRRGVEPSTQRNQDNYWTEWCAFYRSLWQDPLLRDIDNPKILLGIFAVRVRDGRNSRSHKPVGAGTASAALRSVGQTLAFMGRSDPHLDPGGRIDVRISLQLRLHGKDGSSTRSVATHPSAHHSACSGIRISQSTCAAEYSLCCRPFGHCILLSNAVRRILYWN